MKIPVLFFVGEVLRFFAMYARSSPTNGFLVASKFG
jgi:hypothetical protein